MEFTPEEKKILKDCSREGSYYRGLPVGAICGIMTNHFLKPTSSLYHRKYKALPAAIFASMFGYLAGKGSYYSSCLRRLLDVPNGTFRQTYEDHMRKSGMYDFSS